MKVKRRESNSNVMTMTSERNIMGKSAQVKVKYAVYRFFGLSRSNWRDRHGLEGFVYYIQKGDKTGIIIGGD